MKLQQPTRPQVADEARVSRIRYMVLNFRKRSLTPADHLLLSKWLDESEANQQLFEKWIIEPRDAHPVDLPANQVYSGDPYSRKRKGLVLVVILLILLASALLFLILR